MPITAVTNQTALMRQNPNYVQYANGVCYQAIAALENFNSALVDCEEGDRICDVIERLFFVGPGDFGWNQVVDAIRVIVGYTRHGLRDTNLTINVGWYNFVNANLAPTVINLAAVQMYNDYQFVRYLIHEATHLFADTIDHAERGYTDHDGNYRQAGLTAAEALVNADSVAVAVTLFVFGFLN